MSSRRYRSYVFTHNNYENTDLEDNLDCKYIIYGKEVAPTTNTPHLQGFVSFHTVKSFKQVAKLLPGLHIEPAENPEAAIEYCKKEGDWTERGSYIPQKRKTELMTQSVMERWDDARKKAKEGRFDEIPSDIYCRYTKNCHMIYDMNKLNVATIDGDMEHEWIFGPAGAGKSRTARDENPGAYIKDLTKWWDNYQGEEVVIIDDIDKYDVKFARYIKLWADRYPFQAEMKGSTRLIRPKKIVITSQYAITDIWEDVATCEALARRFKIRFLNNNNL